MKYLSVFAAIFVSLAALSAETEIEKDYSKYHPLQNGLGTMGYPATEKESKQLAGVEGKKDDNEKLDILAGNKDKRVAWFGIVREIKEDKGNNRTELLVQHCYFDGLTDTHIQIISLLGGGDFRAVLDGVGHAIPKLALVRVVGIVKADEQNVPNVSAAYVRFWEPGTFAFMAYGTDKSNEKWVKMRKIKDTMEAYSARPNKAYYEKLLGD